MDVLEYGEQQAEFLRCQDDPKYFINTYGYMMGKELDGTATGRIPFKTFRYQDDSIDLFLSEDAVIILKARQLGLSWTVAAYALWLAMFHKYQRILIISINETESQVFLEKVKFIFDNLPDWLKPSIFKRNETTLWFGVKKSYDSDECGGLNSRIDSIPTSKNAGSSRSLNLLIIDEAAKVEYMSLIWKSAQPALSATGGKAILVSTMTTEPTGEFFEQVWNEAEEDKNDFCNFFIPFNAFPGRDDEWLKRQLRKMPVSERVRAKQEYPRTPEEAFQAMGGKYFDIEELKWHKQYLQKPKAVGYLVEMNGVIELRENEEGTVTIYEWPEPDEEYVVGGDPAEGIEQDFSALVVVRKRDQKLVAKFHSNVIDTETVASIADKLARLYRYGLAAVEANNNHGGIVNILLKDRYFNVYFHDIVDRESGQPTKRWGWLTTGQNRTWILDWLDMQINNHACGITDSDLWHEMFEYIVDPKTGNGMHKKGKHDDLLIAYAIALWVIRENPYVPRKHREAERIKRKQRRPQGGY